MVVVESQSLVTTLEWPAVSFDDLFSFKTGYCNAFDSLNCVRTGAFLLSGTQWQHIAPIFACDSSALFNKTCLGWPKPLLRLIVWPGTPRLPLLPLISVPACLITRIASLDVCSCISSAKGNGTRFDWKFVGYFGGRNLASLYVWYELLIKCLWSSLLLLMAEVLPLFSSTVITTWFLVPLTSTVMTGSCIRGCRPKCESKK